MGGAAVKSAPMWRRYLRLRGPDVEADVDDELAFHVEMRTRDLIAGGMDPRSAREEALRRFGDLGRVRAECRELGAGAVRRQRRRESLGSLAQDVRYAGRILRRSPGFTAVIVLTIALGVGATTAIFSALNAVLLRPLPYPAAEELVIPLSERPATGDRWGTAYADFVEWEREGVFERVALYSRSTVDLLGEGEPENVPAARIISDLFAVLRLAPVLGRTFRPEEFEPGAPTVGVISHALWQRRYGGAPDVIGRVVRAGGEPTEIVGVIPPEIDLVAGVDLWRPLQITPDRRAELERPDNYMFGAIARLRPGSTVGGARSAMTALALRLEAEHPQARAGVTQTLVTMDRWITGEDLPRALWLFLGAVTVVLLIGCVNVANLLMSRAATRARELAIRSAIGAGRGRLVRQLLTESVVLALAGGVLGVLLAYWSVGLLVAAAPPGIPRVDAIAVDTTVLGFALAVSLLASLLFGLAPALHASRGTARPELREAGLKATMGRRGRRVRAALIAAELALSLVLLAGAGLLLRSLGQLHDTDPGFRAEHLLTFSLGLQGDRYPRETRPAAFHELLGRLEAVPGVESVAAVSALPLGGGGFYLGRAFLAEGQPEPPAGRETRGMWNVATPGYFATAGIALLQGRGFTEADVAESVPVMIVSREFARQMFPDGDALGKRVRSWRDENVYREVVGITDDVLFRGVDDELMPFVYVPHTQDAWGSMQIVARTAGDPRASLPTLRAAVRGFDPELALAGVKTMDEVLSRSMAPRRFGAMLLGGFAAIGILLAAVGVYGVLSYVVAQRTREIGIRMALGAGRPAVMRMVLREVMAVVVVGALAGLAGAMLLGPLLAPLLYRVSPTDPSTHGAVAALLVLVALLAAWLPARRATRVDPLTAIRWE